MLTAIQHASIASKVVALQAPPAESNGAINGLVKGKKIPPLSNAPLSVSALLYLATLGGADLCGLRDHTGSLEEGKAFDALRVDLRPGTGNPTLWWEDSCQEEQGRRNHEDELHDFLEKFLFCGDDRNIAEVFVEGRLVGGKQFVFGC